jgi:GMP synthase-like glutamine amidotransferase
LTVVHQDDAGTGVFADEAVRIGAELVEWRITQERRPDGRFDALIVLGGAASPDEQDGLVPYEVELLQQYVADDLPVLGICLGGQLLARALGAEVAPLEVPRFGWHDVELLEEASHDPLLGGLPSRFAALLSHSYGFGLPKGAVALGYAQPSSLQAFRYGRRAWALQFHPEVTADGLLEWIDLYAAARDRGTAESAELASIPLMDLPRRTAEEIGRWNDVGRMMLRRFVEVI